MIPILGEAQQPFDPALLRKMSEVAAKSTRDLVAEETYGAVLCLCSKRVPVCDVPILKSSLVPYMNTVCACCESKVKGLARLVCLQCKEIVICAPPSRQPNGFELKGDRVYHIPNCPKCAPEISQVQIVERTVFDAQQKRR